MEKIDTTNTNNSEREKTSLRWFLILLPFNGYLPWPLFYLKIFFSCVLNDTSESHVSPCQRESIKG
jgi:hypothetical protein